MNTIELKTKQCERITITFKHLEQNKVINDIKPYFGKLTTIKFDDVDSILLHIAQKVWNRINDFEEVSDEFKDASSLYMQLLMQNNLGGQVAESIDDNSNCVYIKNEAMLYLTDKIIDEMANGKTEYPHCKLDIAYDTKDEIDELLDNLLS